MGRIIDVVVDPSASQILGLPLPQFFALLSGVFALGAVASFGRVILFRLSGMWSERQEKRREGRGRRREDD